jgi:hypothetical protein
MGLSDWRVGDGRDDRSHANQSERHDFARIQMR